MPKERKKPFDHWKFKYAKLTKIFAALGSITAIVFHIMMMVESFRLGTPNPVQTVILPIFGMLICITILGSIEVFGPRWFIKATWYVLLIGGILEAVIFGVVPRLFQDYNSAWGLAGVFLIIASGLLSLIEAL
ncbi:MAG: hypothetical protein JW776_10025 [Candidatus Lokiarchaeota archaeon]|nr:hypothetical protein [Candidatus Lokiarchaeota archaeon]